MVIYYSLQAISLRLWLTYYKNRFPGSYQDDVDDLSELFESWPCNFFTVALLGGFPFLVPSDISDDLDVESG